MTYDIAKLIEELEHDEGRRGRVYHDSIGIPTIGVGWNLEANELPADVIDRLLAVSIERAEEDLDAIAPRWRELDDGRQRVLINMAFNLGRARLEGFTRFWAAIGRYLDTGQHEHLWVAASEMIGSKWASQVGPRARRLAERMRT